LGPPACPAEWRSKVDDDHAITDAKFAGTRGISVDEYRAAALVRLRELLARPQLRMRIHQGALARWLEDGEFKTMLQGAVSTGSTDRADRLQVEHSLFGIPIDADPRVRPRYGYMKGSAEDHRELNKHGLVVVRLDGALVAETTVVLGDSMGSTNIGGWESMAPEPVGDPDLPCRFSNADVCSADSLAAACHDRFEFAEIQIFASVRIEHIVELVFCGGEVPDDGLRREIRDLDLRLRELAGFL
jgi:hypothetical protein